MSGSLSNVLIEAIARAAFPELADARPWTVARKMGDCRDIIEEGLTPATCTPQERLRVLAAAAAAGITLAAHEPTSPVFAGAA